MNLILDVRTMGILSSVTPLILGLVMAIYWRERKVYRGFKHWILANFGFSLGYLLISVRGAIPDFFSIILGSAITVYGEILIYEGIQLFYERRAFSRLNYLILGSYVILQYYFTYLNPDIKARIVLSSIVFFVLILRSAISLIQCPIPKLMRTARSAGTIFFVTALFPISRGIYASRPSQPIDLFSDQLSSWYSIAFIAFIVAWTF